MKKIIVAVALVALAGCQTRITAEKNPEIVLPVYKVANVAGTNTLYVCDYVRASGGWYATARSPIWATESLRGLTIGVQTNGMVSVGLEDYHRDLSTNAVALTQVTLDGAANLAAKIGAAIATQGGSASADAIAALVRKFVSSGGDASKASISCSDGSCTITDG